MLYIGPHRRIYREILLFRCVQDHTQRCSTARFRVVCQKPAAGLDVVGKRGTYWYEHLSGLVLIQRRNKQYVIVCLCKVITIIVCVCTARWGLYRHHYKTLNKIAGAIVLSLILCHYRWFFTSTSISSLASTDYEDDERRWQAGSGHGDTSGHDCSHIYTMCDEAADKVNRTPPMYRTAWWWPCSESGQSQTVTAS